MLDSKFVFIHIGKTAGTAVRASFEAAFGPGACPPHFIQSYMTEQEAEYYATFPIVCGHISRADQLKWFPAHKIMTILREPIERGFSFLNYVYSLPADVAPIAADAKLLSMLEIIETDEGLRNLNNTMVRQLGGHLLDDPTDLDGLLESAKEALLEAIWVGAQFSLEHDWQRLQARFDNQLVLGLENVTPVIAVTPRTHPAILSRLRDLNCYDCKLWDWALSHPKLLK